VAWAANCTDAMGMGGDVVQGLRSELLEARSMLVEVHVCALVCARVV
jgi:hypothetical protein